MLIRVIQISARAKRPAFAKATAWLTDTTLFWSKRSDDFFEARIPRSGSVELFGCELPARGAAKMKVRTLTRG